MTKIINFDELKTEPKVILKIDGVEHPMVNASIDTFITNMSELEKLGINGSPVKELEVIVGVVQRAFPSLTEAQIRKWEITQIQQISDLARGISGEVASTDEAKIEEANASGNAPTAS